MKLAIVAATGGIGRHVLDQAVAAGHDVTVIVRNPRKLSQQGVRTVAADLATVGPADLEPAFDGVDAVLSGLGPRSSTDAGVTAAGTRAILTAMNTTGARRIVVVSAAPIGTVASPGRPSPPKHDPGDAFLMRYLFSPIIKSVLRTHYADLAIMEDALRDSDTDWTAVRPPRLTDKPRTGTYRTAYGRNLPGGMTIARADVADYMLRALTEPASIRQTVGVAY